MIDRQELVRMQIDAIRYVVTHQDSTVADLRREYPHLDPQQAEGIYETGSLHWEDTPEPDHTSGGNK